MMTEHQTKKSERTCVGCGKHAEPSALVRLVLGPGDAVAVDAAGGAFGRGAHVHPSMECVSRACRGGLSKAFRREVKADASALRNEIREAYERRAIGIILGARGAGHLALGADASQDAMKQGAPLVVIATDAGSVTKGFERAIAEGRAASFGTTSAAFASSPTESARPSAAAARTRARASSSESVASSR